MLKRQEGVKRARGPASSQEEPGAEPLLLAVYRQHGQTLYGYIRRMLGNTADAEDIMQETIARALDWTRATPLPESEESRQRCRRWLFQVATHLSLDLLRKRKRSPLRFWQALLQPQTEAERERGEDEDVPLQVADPALSVQETIIQQALIRAAFGAMKPAEVSVLLLHEHYGFSLAEVADMRHCSYAAAAKKVARARQQFARHYRSEAGEEDER